MKRIVTQEYDVIWQTIRCIPYGKVSTYGEIARLSGHLGHARRVGRALRETPNGMNLPWHRVINAQGRISLSKSGGSYGRQKRLLIREGVTFIRERVDLNKHLWRP